MMKAKRIYSLVILSLVLLFNPSINILDLLPDFIAYALLVFIIGDLAESVPYLAECKDALTKLAIVTLIRIPAFLIMYSNMRYGSDIVPLFTLSFNVLEYVFIYGAVKNLFRAFSYLGERTDCESVRSPFPVSKRKSSTPEALERLTLLYFLVKGLINILPELFLLSSDDFAKKRELMNVYPTALVISVMASLAIGALWLAYAIKYVKFLRSRGDLSESMRTVESYVSGGVSSSDKLKKRLVYALNLLAVSSIFIFDISFQGTGGRNILPHFIYGILVFCSVINLTKKQKCKVILSAFATGFVIAAVVGQILSTRFFDRYQYIDLAYSRLARAEYLSIKITAILETVFIIGMCAVAAIILLEFIKAHTDTSPLDPSYSESNRRLHQRLTRITLPLMIISGVIWVLKCVNVFLKQRVSIIQTAINPDGIPAPGIPVFTTMITLLSVIYLIYSFVATSTLKDEVRMKYGNQ